jgi:hypothetical protein
MSTGTNYTQMYAKFKAYRFIFALTSSQIHKSIGFFQQKYLRSFRCF